MPLMCLGRKIHAGLRPAHERTSLLGARSPLHPGEAGVATVPDTRLRTAGPASGAGLEDTGRAWPEPPRERVTSVSAPHPRLPSPIPVAPPGRNLGTGRPQLCWALGLHLGDELLGRLAPPRPGPPPASHTEQRLSESVRR